VGKVRPVEINVGPVTGAELASGNLDMFCHEGAVERGGSDIEDVDSFE
jgi:hypothetical protein